MLAAEWWGFEPEDTVYQKYGIFVDEESEGKADEGQACGG